MKPLRPNSNWHRLLHLLDVNGGTLYRAQLYQPKTFWDFLAKRNKSTVDHPIRTDGMPKMTNVSAMAPLSFAYEERASQMGLVAIQRYKNRKWITLLPKGRDVLNQFRQHKNWIFDEVAERVAKYGTNVRT